MGTTHPPAVSEPTMYLPRTPLHPLTSYYGRRRFLLYLGTLTYLEDNPGSTALLISLALGLHATRGEHRLKRALNQMTTQGTLQCDALPGAPVYTLTAAVHDYLRALQETAHDPR